MKEFEREEISKLPAKYQPLSPLAYVGYVLLFGIPTVGLICLFIFAFSDDNIARRNMARAYLIVYGVAIVLAILAVVIVVVALGSLGGLVGGAA